MQIDVGVTREIVTACYREMLGREPDIAGLEHYSKQLSSGSMSLADFLRAFLFSSEFKDRWPKEEERGLADFRFSQPQLVEVDASSECLTRLLNHVSETWRSLGEEKPHWSVITSPEFLPENINHRLGAFYETGQQSVELMERALARAGKEIPRQATCFELGCGVGRITFQLAMRFDKVIGADVSAPHLAIATEAIAKSGRENISLFNILSLDALEGVCGFDVFFSLIVLQHNPPPIISRILSIMLDKINTGGYSYFQVPVSIKDYSFQIDDYLSGLPTEDAPMEVHALPQAHLFKVLDQAGMRVLDIQRDRWIGPDQESLSVLAEKK